MKPARRDRATCNLCRKSIEPTNEAMMLHLVEKHPRQMLEKMLSSAPVESFLKQAESALFNIGYQLGKKFFGEKR